MARTFSPLVVSTITATASLTSPVDLVCAFRDVPLTDGILAVRSADGKRVRPVGSLPLLDKTLGKHLTISMVADESLGSRCSVKVFENGTLQITGIKRSRDLKPVCASVARSCGLFREAVGVRTRMVNAYFKQWERPIARSKLVEYLQCKSHTAMPPATFDPALSSIARVHFCFDTAVPCEIKQHRGVCRCKRSCAFLPSRMRRCFKVVAKVHATGTIMMSGACDENHVERAADLLQTYILQAHLQVC